MGIFDKLFRKRQKKDEEYSKFLATISNDSLARETREAKELGDNERLRLILKEVEKRKIPPTLWMREVEK